MHSGQGVRFRGQKGSAARGAIAVLAVVLAPVVMVACSSKSDGADKPDRTSTTAAARTSTSSTTAPRPSTTVTTTVPGTRTGTGPTNFAGQLDGQKARATFTRTSAGIENFEVVGLAIQCQPIDNSAPSSRATRVTIQLAPIKADGSVETTATAAKYKPTLSGSFTPQGTFAGGLFLSGQDSGSVCGGEFTFIAKPT